ncbi:hypothetical protein [Acinetobacter zhairhuonensis]|uniref:hypothetical protein n=1 Tax=Acinetobacter sp. A7.4 TaxID=2919921 RepID=UPI001F4F30F6|nr:hypothetical protein [Acinetobacter sp. A7.4]MCJ8162483.1 hypothetical protein [Acinetobacter sp. A7.4]
MGTTLIHNSRRLFIIGQRIPAIYDVVIPKNCPPAHPWKINRYYSTKVNHQSLSSQALSIVNVAEFIRLASVDLMKETKRMRL